MATNVNDTLGGFNYPRTEPVLLNSFENYSTWDNTFANCAFEVKADVLYITGAIHKGSSDKVLFVLPENIADKIALTHPIGIGEKSGSSGRIDIRENGEVYIDDYDSNMTSVNMVIPLEV